MRWIKKNNIKVLPKKIGVYVFRDAGKRMLYIGKASNIRNRVKSHFERPTFRDSLFMNKVAGIGYQVTGSEIEALLLESKLIKKYQPKYNVMWKDDKKYFYVAITKEKLPRVFLTHQPSAQAKFKMQNAKVKITNQNAKLIPTYRLPPSNDVGPFVDGRALKKTLRFLRRIFPYYTQKKHPLLPCPWCHLELCPGPHPNPREYRKNIKNIIQVLWGRKTSVLKKLKRRIREAAAKKEFEKAAKIRDQLRALENIFSHARVLGEGPEGMPQAKSEWTKTQNALQKILGSKRKISRIEACDIANIQGQEATGSIVTFITGKPAKDFYRKFKIRISGKPNDVAMIAETVSRRLRHKEWGVPDVLLIDGGKGQLNAALKTKNQEPRMKNKIKVLALAKKENELYIEGRKQSLLLKNLPDDVSNLILHLRDESHRFARAYHHKLRSQNFIAAS